MTIRFIGEWSPWAGAALALALAAAAWLLYRRQTRGVALPLLRSLAVALAVLMLTGPVLHRSRGGVERGRVLVLVDASRSMGLTDETLEPSRKLAIAQGLGWLPPEVTDAAHPEAVEAIKRLDTLSRWRRVEALLAGGLLERLARRHDVELALLTGPGTTAAWSSRLGGGPPRALPGGPEAPTSPLGDGLARAALDAGEGRRALVLLTDGRNTGGRSPLQAARALGDRRVPVHAIGLGAAAEPDDLAVLELKAPETVFFKDRLRGEVVLRDGMPAGRPFVLRLECNGRPVWEKSLVTDRSRVRTVPFDFPVQDLVDKALAGAERGVEVLSAPLSLRVTASAVAGEKEPGNNEGGLDVRATMHRRKALLLDGRPRWEFRYLRNLFERDEQWELNELLADRGWERGTRAGMFPPDRESLLAYDLICFGEVPRQHLRMEELQWIREFVERRGGGFAAIDGRRGHLATYADTPIGALLPVDWKADPPAGRPSKLRLTERGSSLPALGLVAEPERSRELWESLPPPRWVAPARALPGAETLAEAVFGERGVPVLVSRRFGAGRVLYCGSDESWRWRQEVADRHHQRFWNQAFRWIMEPPFAARDARVSLDPGKFAYAPGEPARIRARVRDADGRPVERAEVEVSLWRDGRRHALIRLVPDEGGGGFFHGVTPALPEGRYEARVRVEGVPEEETRVRAGFDVRPPESGELAVLTCDEDLLRQVAARSGGEYLREEEAGRLEALLAPLARERAVESSTILWQSGPWFGAIVALLTLEWLLRKRAGMI